MAVRHDPGAAFHQMLTSLPRRTRPMTEAVGATQYEPSTSGAQSPSAYRGMRGSQARWRVFRKGRVWVNDQELKEPYLPQGTSTWELQSSGRRVVVPEGQVALTLQS